YQFRSSLYLTNGYGEPIALPPDLRIYLLSAFQHGGNNPAEFPGPRGNCQNLTNPNYHGPTLRALLIALDRWADRGVSPPDSAVPSVRHRTLVSLDQAREAFPAIPGVEFPANLNTLELLDFGPEFGWGGGRLTVLPPLLGDSYALRVPKPDEDGLDIAGIRPIEIRAPLGTNTGWNVRAEGLRRPHLCALSGSFIPFAVTRAEREATGDPRRSLRERYHNHHGYVQAVRRAASQVDRERFLFEEVGQRFVRQAEDSQVVFE